MWQCHWLKGDWWCIWDVGKTVMDGVSSDIVLAWSFKLCMVIIAVEHASFVDLTIFHGVSGKMKGVSHFFPFQMWVNWAFPVVAFPFCIMNLLQSFLVSGWEEGQSDGIYRWACIWWCHQWQARGQAGNSWLKQSVLSFFHCPLSSVFIYSVAFFCFFFFFIFFFVYKNLR